MIQHNDACRIITCTVYPGSVSRSITRILSSSKERVVIFDRQLLTATCFLAFLARHCRCHCVAASRPINAPQTQAYWVTFARQSFTVDHRSRYLSEMDGERSPPPPPRPPERSLVERGARYLWQQLFRVASSTAAPSLFVFVLGKEFSVFITWWWIWRGSGLMTSGVARRCDEGGADPALNFDEWCRCCWKSTSTRNEF